MHFEVEQKFWIDDPVDLAARFAGLGVEFEAAHTQTDLYFNHPVRDFAQTDEALRIRQVPAGTFVTYKGPKVDTVSKTRRELELPIGTAQDSQQTFQELLVALGFRPVAEVRKQRQSGRLSWRGEQIVIALDQVELLGSFVELEMEADEAGLARAQKAIAAFATEMGLTRNERRSYLELLLASRSEAPP